MDLTDVFILLAYISLFSVLMCVSFAVVFIGRLLLEVFNVLVHKFSGSVQQDRQTRAPRRVHMVDQRRS